MAISEKAAQGQLDAYNAHDLGGFLSWYADDVQGIDHDTGEVLFASKAEMVPRYEERFRDAALHCALVNRMVLRDVVVDHEKITASSGQREAIVIYDVNPNGLIGRVRFSLGQKTVA